MVHRLGRDKALQSHFVTAFAPEAAEVQGAIQHMPSPQSEAYGRKQELLLLPSTLYRGKTLALHLLPC